MRDGSLWNNYRQDGMLGLPSSSIKAVREAHSSAPRSIGGVTFVQLAYTSYGWYPSHDHVSILRAALLTSAGRSS